MIEEKKVETTEDSRTVKSRRSKTIGIYKANFNVGEEDLNNKLKGLLLSLNDKNYGSIVSVKDILIWALDKCVDKDIERIKESSLSLEDKVKRELQSINERDNTELSIYEAFAKKMKIQ